MRGTAVEIDADVMEQAAEQYLEALQLQLAESEFKIVQGQSHSTVVSADQTNERDGPHARPDSGELSAVPRVQDPH